MVRMEALDLSQICINAVCNILLMILFFIPILITLIRDGYTLGGTWCTFTAYFLPTTIMVFAILMNVFGVVLRVWLLDKPAKVRNIFPVSRVYWAVLVSGILAIVPCALFPALGGREECFMVGKLSCAVKIDHDDKVLKAVWWVYTVFLVAIPLVILITGNLYAGRVISGVLKNSRTATKEQKCRVSAMINTICWSFLLSYIPVIAIHIAKLSGWKGEGDGMEPFWCLIPTFFLSIASITKPFILYLSNVKFREYVSELLRCSSQVEGVTESGEGYNNASTKSSRVVKIAARSEESL
jgi:hypothetical protein